NASKRHCTVVASGFSRTSRLQPDHRMIIMTIPETVRRLERDLRGIFGPRLASLSIYGQTQPRTQTLAVVDGLSGADLRACAERVDAWHEGGLATPLLIATHEFESSLDAFPLEFGAIIAD